MGRQLAWRLRHHHHNHYRHHHHNHHRLVVTKLYVKRETCPSILSGTSSPCSAATARLHESAVSLIFCQTDLTGKHEGVRSRAAVRHPTSVCLSSDCLSVALQLDRSSMIFTAGTRQVFTGAVPASVLNAPCPIVLLCLKVHQMDYDTLSVDMSASQTPCVRACLAAIKGLLFHSKYCCMCISVLSPEIL